MKTIKFRFWDSFNGEYFYSDKYEKLSSFFTLYELYELSLSGDNKPILEQFTGLQDKNGVDIYEGDIGARYLDKDKRYTDGKTWRDYWEAEWDAASSGFITTMIAYYDTRYDKVVKTPRNSNQYSKRFNEIEVIGNIHQTQNF